MKKEDIFNLKYFEFPRVSVTVTYMDMEQRTFDNESWDNLKDGIKRNLYDKGLLVDVSIRKHIN